MVVSISKLVSGSSGEDESAPTRSFGRRQVVVKSREHKMLGVAAVLACKNQLTGCCWGEIWKSGQAPPHWGHDSRGNGPAYQARRLACSRDLGLGPHHHAHAHPAQSARQGNERGTTVPEAGQGMWVWVRSTGCECGGRARCLLLSSRVHTQLRITHTHTQNSSKVPTTSLWADGVSAAGGIGEPARVRQRPRMHCFLQRGCLEVPQAHAPNLPSRRYGRLCRGSSGSRARPHAPSPFLRCWPSQQPTEADG
jgi:hypothetical protein